MLPGGVDALRNFGVVCYFRALKNSCACSVALGYFVAVSGIDYMEDLSRMKTLRT